MKTAEITKVSTDIGSRGYDFDLFIDGKPLVMACEYYRTKEDCIKVIKEHFQEFEIVDKTL